MKKLLVAIVFAGVIFVSYKYYTNRLQTFLDIFSCYYLPDNWNNIYPAFKNK